MKFIIGRTKTINLKIKNVKELRLHKYIKKSLE